MPKDRIYDGKVLFQAWCSWGKAARNPRLMEFAKANFGTMSQMGPHYAMWKWAFENPEESFEMYKEWWFDVYPDKDPIQFSEFLEKLKKVGANPNIGGTRKNLERFCAKYNLAMDYNVNPDDVIQVTRKDHALYQTLLIVNNVDEEKVSAYIFNPDGTRSNHQLSVREFGVVGRTIV